MTIVDGLLITGSNTPVDEINTRLTATWFVAPLRWSVNYTTTFKEWLPYRNKQGEIHVRIMSCIKHERLFFIRIFIHRGESRKYDALGSIVDETLSRVLVYLLNRNKN